MVSAIMDDRETLHKRRQWISQYQLENIKAIESRLCEEQKLVQGRGGVVKFVMRHPASMILSMTVLCFMILNLNQGNNLHGYISESKVHHQSHGLRSLGKAMGTACLKTPFVTPQEAVYSTPINPPWYQSKKPSHIELCEELMKRNDYVTNQREQEGSVMTSFTKFTVHETPEFCADGSKPHFALLHMISSSIIANAGERFGLEYKHNCHKVLNANYRLGLDFDVTTVQEVFPEQRMPIDENLFQLGEVVHDLCPSCIEEYNQNKRAYGDSEAAFHCLAIPNRGAVRKATVSEQTEGPGGVPIMKETEAVIDEKGQVIQTALESVLPLVRNRLWHVARDWQIEAQIPRVDPTAGVVIFIDAESSMSIPFQLYRQFIPQHVTRVHILSGPSCAQGNLAISMNNVQPISCLQYGAELREYLNGSYQGSPVQVEFNLVSSSATSLTRMIQSNTLMCPPCSKSCLFPAIAKDKIKNVVLFETPQCETYHWFDYLAKSVTGINVVRLPDEKQIIDSAQQVVEAKYAGFSVDELIGSKPPGMYKPSPSSSSARDHHGVGRSEDYDTMDSYVQGNNAVPKNTGHNLPDVSHMYDAISNHKEDPAYDPSYESSEVRTSSPQLTTEQKTYDSSETNVRSYQDKISSESSGSVPDSDQYELLETDISDFTSSRTIDDGANSPQGTSVVETEIKSDHSKVFKDIDEDNDSQGEVNIGRSQSGEANDSSSLSSDGSSPSDRSESSTAEELMETEVKLDYKNLFHGKRE